MGHTIKTLEHQCGGHLSFVFHDLQNDTTVVNRPNVIVPTASICKLPMLVHIALAVEEGLLNWETPLPVTETSKSTGMGILKGLTTGLRLTLHDVCYLMITLSDNTATNMLIEQFGLEPFNTRLSELGFSHTRLLKQDKRDDASHGYPFVGGVTTPHEMAELLKRLEIGTLCNAATTTVIHGMLADQQDRAGIPRYLPPNWVYAGKTGANPDLRADVGFVSEPGGRRYVLALFCHDLPPINWAADNVDNRGLLAIAQLTQHLLMENTAP